MTVMPIERAVEPQVDWGADPYWRSRRLSPAQILVHDVRVERWRANQYEALLEIKEVLSSSLEPDLEGRDRVHDGFAIEELTSHRTEQTRLRTVAREYGWLNCLRCRGVQESVDDPEEFKKCRWIHISAKFSEYLDGCLLALSEWNSPKSISNLYAIRQLEHCIQQHERFSKHGRYFSPFVQPLCPDAFLNSKGQSVVTPLLISVPFLDWTVEGDPPPLRFQVDKREGYVSSRTQSHPLRSILQHFYRLEDTSDREGSQVFTKHKPWLTDRDLDLKVRRWYGHYPMGLNVDELWILVVDDRHVVTFSSNQSWKSRWPPQQLSARVAEVSFRGIRNNFLRQEVNPDYTALTHVVACLSSAVGILHRSFWSDMPLCLTDRYAGYLGHLQYRLHRAPSTTLVMDLLQVQEELNIVIKITQQQLNVLHQIDEILKSHNATQAPQSPRSTTSAEPPPAFNAFSTPSVPAPILSTYRQLSASSLADPSTQLLSNLSRELADLQELHANSTNLLNRTIQLVNIRLEDHGKAILVFTIVTIVFLPLSFVASFFGMNVTDIRDMKQDQRVFWVVSCSVTVVVVSLSTVVAFYGGDMVNTFFKWKERNRAKRGRQVRVGW
ncbi:hypothetical protein BDY21DRAFT_341310 [Lineolata rhizophorae]|uniref:Cora-like Mg2+ transporter protein-domain-containing protein n=1 Tax=Lineolata rhizophorae TaxID=578093 RepID=A0A6A6P4W0_9PEZI|nr:hypothetical protein BDY21DRAFT_341310 [Lineolata rhizophorae]